MDDKEDEETTVIRALSYMADKWKDRLAEEERAAIKTVQSALARMVLRSIDLPD